MQMQKNYARVVMAVKLSANICSRTYGASLPTKRTVARLCCRHIGSSTFRRGENLLVIVDYYSRYFEVVILRSTISTKVIETLQPIFARFGDPHTLKTDNGPQFILEEFKAFLVENGIEH